MVVIRYTWSGSELNSFRSYRAVHRGQEVHARLPATTITRLIPHGNSVFFLAQGRLVSCKLFIPQFVYELQDVWGLYRSSFCPPNMIICSHIRDLEVRWILGNWLFYVINRGKTISSIFEFRSPSNLLLKKDEERTNDSVLTISKERECYAYNIYENLEDAVDIFAAAEGLETRLECIHKWEESFSEPKRVISKPSKKTPSKNGSYFFQLCTFSQGHGFFCWAVARCGTALFTFRRGIASS